MFRYFQFDRACNGIVEVHIVIYRSLKLRMLNVRTTRSYIEHTFTVVLERQNGMRFYEDAFSDKNNRI
ncbi:hypothetical protein DN407_30310 (plasmid) [Bacillus sp. JAS24-2]|nr:hypothetical protein DN407_30310 [Bacillus sp. JAS24-2]